LGRSYIVSERKKKKKETDEEKGIKKIDPEAMLKALISKL